MKNASVVVDIVVRWGASVLHASTLTPGRTFRIGEDPSSCDCVAPASLLGCKNLTLLWWDGAKRPHVATKSAGEPLASGEFIARLATLEVELSVHPPATPTRRSGSWERAAKLAWALSLSFMSHVACVIWLCVIMPPPTASASVAPYSEEHVFAYRTVKIEPEEAPYDDGIGGDGDLSKAENVIDGYVTSKGGAGTWGNAGPAENPDVHIGRRGEPSWWGWPSWGSDAARFGAPVGPQESERDDALGRDVWSSAGSPSPKRPTPRYGKSRKRAARAGGDADVEEREQQGGADHFGYGLIPWTEKPNEGSRRTHHVGAPSLQRRLPAETVRRVVARHAGGLRLCRAQETDRHAAELAVRFVVGRNGAAEQVSTTGGDDRLTRCVSSVFERMEFPAPPSGPVRVTIPVVFDDAGS